jgi:hypothetical protein
MPGAACPLLIACCFLLYLVKFLKFLRKAIKIKVYTIMLAWVVIFMHSVIPHNHLLENNTGCRELFHGIVTGDNDCDSTSKLESQPGESIVCHFSNFLFNQFSQDNLIIQSNKESHFYPVLLTGSIFVHPSEPYIYRSYHGTSSLRAPPAA